MLLIIVYSATFILTIISAKVGDPCRYANANLPKLKGTCQLAENCPQAQVEFQNGIEVTYCERNLEKKIIIVCCRENGFRNASHHKPTRLQPVNEDDKLKGKRKSVLKCEEYNDLIDNHTCPYFPVPLIIGGSEARLGEFPFMAAIYWRGRDGLEVRCGGTLISDQHILTAAHCAFSRDKHFPVFVRLGVENLSGRNGDYYTFKEIIKHEQYTFPKKYYDIAIVVLDKKVEFTDNIRPACLYTQSNFSINESLAIGYGRTSTFSDKTSEKLMKVNLNIYNGSICSSNFANVKDLDRGFDNEAMVCAGELKGGKDTCGGDSGGPLLVPQGKSGCKFYTIGITSFGRDDCGAQNTVAIYTKVSQFLDWIEKIVWP